MAITIRSGGSASSRKRFKTSVEAVLKDVGRTRTGKIVLTRLNAATYDVIIEPNLEPGGFNNAFEEAASHVHSGNTRLGHSARGTRSIVSYSPKRLSGKGVQMALHEVLLHELCHSLRTVYGRSRFKNRAGDLLPMSGNFSNVEEFFAAMVTSVHSSELGRPALGDHGTWKLPSVDSLRKAPFDRRLREFNTSMPDLCRELRAIPPVVAPFNPFRDVSAP